MSYTEMADLAADAQFKRRLGMCLASESTLKVDDPLADSILRGVAWGVDMFMPWIATAPSFADKYEAGGQENITDADILAAVQSSWTSVANLYATPAAE